MWLSDSCVDVLAVNENFLFVFPIIPKSHSRAVVLLGGLVTPGGKWGKCSRERTLGSLTLKENEIWGEHNVSYRLTAKSGK